MAHAQVSSLLARHLNLSRREIEVPASSVKQLLDILQRDIRGFGEVVLTPEGDVKPFIAIVLNGQLMSTGRDDVLLCVTDKVHILPMLAGG
jgi:hypothetical protein